MSQINLKVVCLLIITGCFCSNVFGLAKTKADADEYVVDEFGIINFESLQARLDNFFVQIDNSPIATAYVTFSRGAQQTPGFPLRYAARIKTYLTQHRGVEPRRVKIFEYQIGVESEFRIRLYVLPNDLDASQIFTHKTLLNTAQTLFFDNYYYSSPSEIGSSIAIGGYEVQEAQASLDAVAELLKKKPKLKVYLIGYSQYCVGCITKSYFDNKGRAQIGSVVQRDSMNAAARILRQEKRYLTNKHGIQSSRVATINGGFKESRGVEVYLVPEKDVIPKLKPIVCPSKRVKQTTKKREA